MLLDFKHQLLNYPVHVLQNGFPRYILVDLLCIFTIKTPLRVYLGYVLESMVEMVIIEFQRTNCLDFLFAIFVNAERNNLLLMLDATILFPLIHKVLGVILLLVVIRGSFFGKP